MNEKELENKKKELYKLSWENKWKNYKKDDFSFGSPCAFCVDKDNHLDRLKDLSKYNGCRSICLIDEDMCVGNGTLFENIVKNRTNIFKYNKAIEKMALEIKKRGGIE